MKKLLIGSTLIKYHFPDFTRVPKDTDYATDVELKSPSQRTGTEVIEYLYNPVLFRYYNDGEVLSVNDLYSLKLSHLFFDINFSKHLSDAILLKEKGAKLNYKLFKELRSFWDTYLPTVRRSNLKMTKEEFFTNAVNETTDSHDDLHHELIKGFREVPAYTKIIKEVGGVEVCDDKFNNLSYQEKIDVVQEESFVMCVERMGSKTPIRVAFQRQLNTCIQKHFPESIAIFAIENYKAVVRPAEYMLEFFNKQKELGASK